MATVFLLVAYVTGSSFLGFQYEWGHHYMKAQQKMVTRLLTTLEFDVTSWVVKSLVTIFWSNMNGNTIIRRQNEKWLPDF